MYEWFCLACMYAHSPCAFLILLEVSRGFRTLGTEVIMDGVNPSCVCKELDPGSLQEQ